MTASLLELLGSGASDRDILAWDESAEPRAREAVAEALQKQWNTAERSTPSFAVAALIAVSSVEELDRLISWCPDPHRPDLVHEVLQRRSLDWRNRLLSSLTQDLFGNAWWLIRAVMRAGVSVEPGPRYLDRLVELPLESARSADVDLVAVLEADPGLLERELFQLLSTEGLTRKLTGWQGNKPWLDAVQTLACGELRPRILDTAWAGLTADWRPVDQRPLLDLLQRIEPTDDELVDRLPGLVRMTTSSNAPIVVWALKQLTALVLHARLDATSVHSVRAPLTMGGKDTGAAHLAMLEKALDAGIADPDAVADTAELGLDHPHDVVRARAARVIARATPDRAQTVVTTNSPVHVEIDVRAPASPFEVLADTDEFVELIIASLARELTGLQVEQLLEAAPRLGPTLDDKARKAVRQAHQRRMRFRRDKTFRTTLLADAAITATTSSRHVGPRVFRIDFDTYDHLGYVSALTQRVDHVVWAMQYADVATGLATPSTVDGAVTLDDLRERLSRTEGRTVLRVELAAAALRLPPSEYDAAESLDDTEAGRALLRDVHRLREHHPDWAIHRWRRDLRPGSDYPSFVTCVVAQDESPRPDRVPDVLDALLDRRALISDTRIRGGYTLWEAPYASKTQMLSLSLPHHREHYAAHVLGPLRPGSADDEPDTVAASILDLGSGPGPTGPVTVAALASATALLRPENRTSAIDAIVERATFGELDGPAFGRALREKIEHDDIVPRRMAIALTEAGSALGPLAGPVVDALCELLPVLRHLPDGHAFASALADFSDSLERRIDLPDDLADLRKARGSTALARALRRIRTD